MKFLAVDSTSFPGSLILPPPGASEGGGKMRDPGNKVAVDLAFPFTNYQWI